MPEDGYMGEEIIKCANDLYEKERKYCVITIGHFMTEKSYFNYFADHSKTFMLALIKKSLENFHTHFDE
jgi:hypothetical protein